jgi:beta-ureidopropionase / N-carbamoyl-L-amino-acid hydrolase
MLTITHLNNCSNQVFVDLLTGIYEHSPWVAEQAANSRPLKSLAHLKLVLAQVVDHAPLADQLSLIRAHPELAGKAMVANTLTDESSNEQSKAGLTHCSAAEFEQLQQLNHDYNTRFGFPFILAVRGPRGDGLTRQQIIATFARRINNHPDFERAECLRNIHRIAEIRLNDKFVHEPSLGNKLLDWSEQLALHSDPGYKERGELTVTYLTAAHLACAKQITEWMRECGFDSVHTDAVGNVVGVYNGSDSHAQKLLTGSHYDTVRNGGKYDGRLGILVPMLCVEALYRQGKRLKHGIEVVAFAEEEGQRYKATFLGSGALTGDFNPAWLNQTDTDGISMQSAMREAGLDSGQIHTIKRNPEHYLGFVEVHIEQGPVLNQLGLPLGVVTSINGSVRYLGEITGMASHAGTTPMSQRRDAACAVAELILLMETEANNTPDVVATVGQLQVPNGSINVIPGRAQFSLDIRATTNAARDASTDKILAGLKEICQRRGLGYSLEQTLAIPAAPSAPAWQSRWEQAVQSLGLPIFQMPSGAGHDAMKLHEIMPQAMLFTRGLNAGISHNPLEAITNDDAELTIQAFQHLLHNL